MLPQGKGWETKDKALRYENEGSSEAALLVSVAPEETVPWVNVPPSSLFLRVPLRRHLHISHHKFRTLNLACLGRDQRKHAFMPSPQTLQPTRLTSPGAARISWNGPVPELENLLCIFTVSCAPPNRER